MQDFSKYFLDGEVEQPQLPKTFSNFLQTFQYENGKRMPFIAVYHKGVSQKTFWYNCICCDYSQSYDDQDMINESPARVFKMKAYVITDFSIYEPDGYDFKSKLKKFCSDKEKPSDAFFIEDFVSEPTVDVLTLVEDFVYYYYHMGILEKNMHSSMSFYEDDDNDLDEDGTEEKIKIDG